MAYGPPITEPMVIASPGRSAYQPDPPELKEIPIPTIDRKDVTERQAIAGALKALPSIAQVGSMAEGLSIEQREQIERNAKLRQAYSADRQRLKRDAAISRIQENQQNSKLAKRDTNAAKAMKRRGNATQRFAKERIKNIARSTGLGPQLYRVLR